MNWQASSILTASNFYECLQVSHEASPAEVTHAFRQLAKQYHPDIAPKWLSSGALFLRLREAYETLSNPAKREVYDESLARRQLLRGRMERASRTGSAFTHGAGQTQRQPAASNFVHSADLDLSATIAIPWEKGIYGGLQKVRLNAPDSRHQPLRTNLVVVRVPEGCLPGHQVQVPFYGRVERSRRRAGHLNIKIEYPEEARFRLAGSHLHTIFELDAWDAALGGKFSVDSPLGPIGFEVPAGTRHLQNIRVAGAGLPQKSGRRGDLIVCTKIRVPAAQTAEQKRLWAALKKAHD